MSHTPQWYREHFPKEAKDADKIYKQLGLLGYIKKFREDWNLPPEGCSTDRNFQKWYSSIIVDQSNLSLTKPFFLKMQEELKKIKLAWVDGKIPFNEIENYSFRMNLCIPSFKFDYDIENIINQLGIPYYFQAFVQNSLTCKQKPQYFPLEKSLPKIDFALDPETRRKRLFIEVFSDTKSKDLSDKLFLEKLKDYQKKLYDFGTIKQIGVKDINKADQIYSMQKDGMTIKQIQNKLQIRNVATILKRHRKQLGLGTRKKDK